METAPRPISCLIADDHPAMVEAVATVLRDHGLEIAGRARDGAEALAKLESLKPDVAIVDLRMPRMTGIELARRASKLQSPPAIVLYTAYGDRALLMEAM